MTTSLTKRKMARIPVPETEPVTEIVATKLSLLNRLKTKNTTLEEIKVAGWINFLPVETLLYMLEIDGLIVKVSG
ncbi:MAG: hypothetical protein M5Z89_14120, partial [Olivibacter sp.]|nr:hypothetical protein [Olivibacter sp. UJ_SKK_5.1]